MAIKIDRIDGWAGTSVALHVSPTGTAGMLSERGADGYILV